MDFDEWANSLAHQFAVIADAPVPFAVTVILVALLMWKALRWRYDGIIDQQREFIAHLERRPNAPASMQPMLPEPPPETPGRAASQLESKERVFVAQGVSVASLAKMIRGLNGIQAENLTAPFKGKWIEVTAQVLGCGMSMGTPFLNLMPDTNSLDFDSLAEMTSAFFPKGTEGLEVFARGDTVTVAGEIEHFSRDGLVLMHCELAPT